MTLNPLLMPHYAPNFNSISPHPGIQFTSHTLQDLLQRIINESLNASFPIRVINLTDNGIDDACCRVISEVLVALEAVGITRIVLSGNPLIGDDGVIALTKAYCETKGTLREIKVCNARCSTRGLIAVLYGYETYELIMRLGTKLGLSALASRRIADYAFNQCRPQLNLLYERARIREIKVGKGGVEICSDCVCQAYRRQ